MTSTVTAAPYVWKLLQAFCTQFPDYGNHNFGSFTESYGGALRPRVCVLLVSLALPLYSSSSTERRSSESQNADISQGTVSGVRIPLVALGINNGWVRTRYYSLCLTKLTWLGLGSLIRHSNTKPTLPILSQIPTTTAPSLLSPKLIHTLMRTIRTVFPHLTLVSVLAQTQIAKMPGLPATATFWALFQRATSMSTTSVL